MHRKVMSSNPKLTTQNVISIIANKWKNLTKIEKETYKGKATEP